MESSVRLQARRTSAGSGRVLAYGQPRARDVRRVVRLDLAVVVRRVRPRAAAQAGGERVLADRALRHEPARGRGAEIDVLEVMPGDEALAWGMKKPYVSTSLQLGPGVTAARPDNGNMPLPRSSTTGTTAWTTAPTSTRASTSSSTGPSRRTRTRATRTGPTRSRPARCSRRAPSAGPSRRVGAGPRGGPHRVVHRRRAHLPHPREQPAHPGRADGPHPRRAHVHHLQRRHVQDVGLPEPAAARLLRRLLRLPRPRVQLRGQQGQYYYRYYY